MRNATVLLTTIALAACGEFHWHRPGADPGSVSADFEACRAQAQTQIGRAIGIGPSISSRLDPRFGADTSQPGPADRRIQEQELADRCMRDKGYSLVPGVKTEDK